MPPKVLFVDDAEEMRRIYAQILRNEVDCEVREASSAQGAVAVLENWHPDLIVTDLSMPGMNGLELITWVRSHLKEPHPQIVAISGFPDLEREALSRGAAAFHLKPIEPEDFVEFVQAFLHGEKPPGTVTRRTLDERRVASEMAERALGEVPDIEQRADGVLPLISTYFGGPAVSFLFIKGGELRILSSSDEKRYPKGTRVTGALRCGADVIQSSSVLVISDLRALQVTAMPEPDLKLLVMVPVTRRGTVIGSLAVTDEHATNFDSADVAILQMLADSTSQLLSGKRLPGTFFTTGVLGYRDWEMCFHHELSHITEAHALTVVMLDAIDSSMLGEPSLEIARALPPKTALAMSFENRLCLYGFGSSVSEIERMLAEPVGELRQLVRSPYMAVVSFDGVQPPREPDVVLSLAESVLSAARERGAGSVVRAAVRPEMLAARPLSGM